MQEVQHGSPGLVRADGRERQPATIVHDDADELDADAGDLVAAVAGDPVKIARCESGA